jgi:uncharacterized protein YkwD
MSIPPIPAAPAVAALAVLAACAEPATQVPMGPDGRPLPVLYRISASDAPRIQVRMRDAVNALRGARGLAPLELNVQLTSAAATQARDMSVQQRAWHFGSDGSSPVERVARAGYRGVFLGELVAETYETELETLAGWMETREARAVLLDTRLREIGFAWHQEASGKLWWTATFGAPALDPPA